MTPGTAKVGCDFNARGLSGEPGDRCFYAFAKDDLAKIIPQEGMQVTLYDEDESQEGTKEFLCCDALLEKHDLPSRGTSQWRANPIEDTWRHLSVAEFEKL